MEKSIKFPFKITIFVAITAVLALLINETLYFTSLEYNDFQEAFNNSKDEVRRETLNSFWRRNKEALVNNTKKKFSESLSDPNSWDIEKTLNDLFSLLHAQKGLSQSMLSRPSSLNITTNLIRNVISKRLDFINNKSSVYSPPLYVAIFGGSVTDGVVDTNKFKYGYPWCVHLESIVNSYFAAAGSERIIEIHRFTAGGSGSDVAATLIEFGAFQELKYDIIISAFFANDLRLIKSGFNVLESLERFFLLSKNSQPCSNLPLLINIDDHLPEFMGHMSKLDVKTTFDYIHKVHGLAKWHDVLQLSFCEPFRSYFHLSPLFGNPNGTKFIYNTLHPDGTFHIGLSWMILYNVFYLDREYPLYQPVEDRFPIDKFIPPLQYLSTYDQFSSKWKTKLTSINELCSNKSKIANVDKQKCIFTMIGNYHFDRTKEMIGAKFAPFVTNCQGWAPYGFPVKKPRRAWLAYEFNATFTFTLHNISSPLNVIKILYMHSYGPDWKDSSLRVTAKIIPSKLNLSKNSTHPLYYSILNGSHLEPISVYVPAHISFTHPADIGETIIVTFDLIGGNKFQIGGLAFCFDVPFY